MRSYTNKESHVVTVSKLHLDTAVKIKKELQSASPSRKCSWRTLVRMMEQEGFDDAENSENYRAMIKFYQKSIGELPTAKTTADLVTSNKLESIKSLVGDMAYEKEEHKHILKELNKAKKVIIDYSLTAEQIGKAFSGYDWSRYHMKVSKRKPTTGKKMIVCLSDMHIGALVNVETNTYNFEVALQRLRTYAEEVIATATEQGVSEIHIVNLGDAIEHSNMRYGQAFHAEFVYNEQIVRASDAIIKFLIPLAEEGFSLTYAGIAGNHDRGHDKDKNIDGDHAIRPINYAISLFIEHSKFENITFVKSPDYSHHIKDLNGINIKFIHGDLDSYKNEQLVTNHSGLDGIEYSAVVSGHVHHHRNIEVGYRKRIIVFGSLKGADEYGEKIRKMSIASQGYIIIDASGKMDVRQVEFE